MSRFAVRCNKTSAQKSLPASKLSHANRLADVLHLGDVIEHMTKINEQMPEILKLIKPGGFLIAQGPLEANFNVFTLGIRLSRSFRSAQC